MHKRIFLIFISLCTIAWSLIVSFFIVERFFFDKLIYQKSTLHGYGKNFLDEKSYFLHDRYRDIYALARETQSASQVLGIATDKEGPFVLAIIGDSIPFGMGLREEEAFPAILLKKLNEIRPTVVLSLANPGDNIVHNYTKFLLAEEKFHPDLYVIGVVENDLLINPDYNFYPGQSSVFKSLIDDCPQPLFSNFDLYNITDDKQAISQVFSPSFSDDYAGVCILREVAKRIHATGKSVIYYDFQFIPVRTNTAYLESKEVYKKDREMRQKYDQIIRDNGGYVIGLDRYENPWEPISAKEGHPSRRMHQKFAEQLYQEILKNPEWRRRQDSNLRGI